MTTDRIDTSSGPRCSLAPADHRRAARDFTTFAADHLAGVEVAITARFAGQSENAAFVRAALAREARCCGFLDWSAEEDGDQIVATVRSTGDGLAELARLLEALDVARSG